MSKQAIATKNEYFQLQLNIHKPPVKVHPLRYIKSSREVSEYNINKPGQNSSKYNKILTI